MSHDLDRVLARLAEALPGHAISGLRPLTTGFSNETYLVEGARPDPALATGSGIDAGRLWRA